MRNTRGVQRVRYHFGAERLSFSAIRVCQPGPVDRQRSITSSVRRIEISLFGFKDRGRPPLLMVPRASISSVNSGSSSYSCGWMTCAATLDRSDPKEWRDTRFLSVICFPHAEDVAIRATRRVADHHHSITKHPKADDSFFAVVLAQVFRLESRACKDQDRIRKVKASRLYCFDSLRWVVGDCHVVSVATKTSRRN
jgi:hypothetical protein